METTERTEKKNRWKQEAGQYVVYRLSPASFPRLGKLVRRNECKDWEIGCWLVRCDDDGRLYAVQTGGTATMRPATVDDIQHFRRSGRKFRDKQVEAVAALDVNAPAVEVETPKVKRVRKAKGIAGQIAETVERELEARA
jgi:hypothetical protein